MTGLKLHQGKSRLEIREKFLHRMGGLALDQAAQAMMESSFLRAFKSCVAVGLGNRG